MFVCPGGEVARRLSVNQPATGSVCPCIYTVKCSALDIGLSKCVMDELSALKACPHQATFVLSAAREIRKPPSGANECCVD